MEDTKQFMVVMPFTGRAIATIEATSEEEAIEKFLENASLNLGPPKRDTDVEVEEWSFIQNAVKVVTLNDLSAKKLR